MSWTMSQVRTCPQCTAENPAAAGFCMACGTRLERRCATCGEPAVLGARFCSACGSALEDGAAAGDGGAAASTETPSHTRYDGARGPQLEERRTVTVLFADLSGYTAIS